MTPPLLYPIERFFIRSCRVFFGAVIAVLCAWPADALFEIAQKPFASLTLGHLFMFVFLGFIIWMLAMIAFGVAFGEGPPKPNPRTDYTDYSDMAQKK